MIVISGTVNHQVDEIGAVFGGVKCLVGLLLDGCLHFASRQFFLVSTRIKQGHKDTTLAMCEIGWTDIDPQIAIEPGMLSIDLGRLD